MCVIPLWPIPQAGNFLQFGFKYFPITSTSFSSRTESPRMTTHHLDVISMAERGLISSREHLMEQVHRRL